WHSRHMPEGSAGVRGAPAALKSLEFFSMAEFNIRTDSVDVEQIMRQIRARIQEKRGVDYTEQQIQELANVKLQRFLDPKGVRSDLVEQFKRTRGTSPEPPNYGFEDTTLYETHRGIVRLIRKLLNPDRKST